LSRRKGEGTRVGKELEHPVKEKEISRPTTGGPTGEGGGLSVSEGFTAGRKKRGFAKKCSGGG